MINDGPKSENSLYNLDMRLLPSLQIRLGVLVGNGAGIKASGTLHFFVLLALLSAMPSLVAAQHWSLEDTLERCGQTRWW